LGVNATYAQTDSTTINVIEADTATIPFVTYWSIGDSFRYRITKEEERWKNNEQVKLDSSSFESTMTVVDSTSAGYLISWTYETNLTDDFGVPDALSEKLSKYDVQQIHYRISEVGEFVGIEDWETLATMMDSMFIDVIDVLATDNPESKESIAEIMQPIRAAYTSKEGLESVVFQELSLLHFAFGAEFLEDEAFEYEEMLPNLLGGDPLRGVGKISVDSVDFDENYCRLIQEMKLNEEDTKNMLTSFFKKINTKGEDIDMMMEKSKIEITDYNIYEYYYFPGVPILIETKREAFFNINGEGGKRIDKRKIEWLR